MQPIDVRDVADRLAQLAAGPAQGRALDLGGPQVRTLTDLGRTWIATTGRRQMVLPVYLPGAVWKGYRSGGQTAPDHADGRITFEEYLEDRPTQDRSWHLGRGRV